MNFVKQRFTISLLAAVVPLLSYAQTAGTSGNSSQAQTSGSSLTTMPTIIVVAQAPAEPARQQIDFSVGTSTYTLTQQQIDTIAQGENTSFNQVLVRVPGVSDDTYGAIHFRNEDPYYRYYINGTLLPDGINGFSQDIDTRFVQSVTVKVGALSAQYPEGNYGIVDIQTKTGASSGWRSGHLLRRQLRYAAPHFFLRRNLGRHRFLFHRQLSSQRSWSGKSDAQRRPRFMTRPTSIVAWPTSRISFPTRDV